jgi:hypothetical protein
MRSLCITEAAFSLLGGEGRHGVHAPVRHAGEGFMLGSAVILLTSQFSYALRLWRPMSCQIAMHKTALTRKLNASRTSRGSGDYDPVPLRSL